MTELDVQARGPGESAVIAILVIVVAIFCLVLLGSVMASLSQPRTTVSGPASAASR